MKKVIKLTETELKSIIKESIHAILKDKPNIIDGKIDINSIDISKIDIEILRQAYVDLRLVPTRMSYDSFLSNIPKINEAEGDILSPDNVVNEILQKYHLDRHLVLKIEASNSIFVYIITACIGMNDILIEDDMNKMGYFLSCRGNIQNINGMAYQVLQFEPYSQMQSDETITIKQKYTVLYHWTPEYNLSNILQNGLIPNHQNKMFNYPNRTYLMKGDSSLYEMLELGRRLCIVNKDSRNNGEYALLSINLVDIDDTIHFYYDPNASLGVYTEQNIPPSHIQKVGNYNFRQKNR